jgi:S-adenosylmethionine decarboxylase
METLGRHVIADLWECKQDLLLNIDTVEKIMVDAALEAGADVREVTFHQFNPHGVSGVVVISESHLTIHSFPEHNYASVDVYTCGDMNPHVATKYLAEQFQAKRLETLEILRGQGSLKVEKPRLEVIAEK